MVKWVRSRDKDRFVAEYISGGVRKQKYPMTLTPILFFLLLALGLTAALFVHPRYGLYAYFVAFFMSPKGTWWEDLVPDWRYLLTAGVVTLAAMFLSHRNAQGMKWTEIGGFKILVVFVIAMFPINFWAVEPDTHWEGCILYTKHVLITYAIYRLCDDREMLKTVCLIMVVGCCWFGWQAYGKSGRLEGVAGAISDANTLGMHMSTGVMFAAMMFLGFKGRYKWVAFMCIPLILNTVIVSGSRGAFLGLVSGGLASALFCPRAFRGQFSILAVLGLILFFMLAHDQFLDRIASIFFVVEGQEAMDQSAASRFDIALAGWEMAKDYPLGAGHKGTRALSPAYIPAHLLSEGRRAAHNSVMAALVSYGFLGAGLYVMLYVWAAKQLFRLKRIAEIDRDTDLGIFTAMFAATLATVSISGMFSNFVFAEIQFWTLGLLAATMNLPEIRDRIRNPKKVINAEKSNTPSVFGASGY